MLDLIQSYGQPLLVLWNAVTMGMHHHLLKRSVLSLSSQYAVGLIRITCVYWFMVSVIDHSCENPIPLAATFLSATTLAVLMFLLQIWLCHGDPLIRKNGFRWCVCMCHVICVLFVSLVHMFMAQNKQRDDCVSIGYSVVSV